MSLLLFAVLLWAPGVVLHRAFGLAKGPWGTGRFAVEAALSLAFLSAVLLPLYVAGASVSLLAPAVAMSTACLALAAWNRRRTALADDAGRGRAILQPLDGASMLETAAFVLALAVLVPVTLANAGANVDDWWDLSFVNGWISAGRLGFAQMALSADPGGTP